MSRAGADDKALDDAAILLFTLLAGLLIRILDILEFPLLSGRQAVIIHARTLVFNGFLENGDRVFVDLFQVILPKVLNP